MRKTQQCNLTVSPLTKNCHCNPNLTPDSFFQKVPLLLGQVLKWQQVYLEFNASSTVSCRRFEKLGRVNTSEERLTEGVYCNHCSLESRSTLKQASQNAVGLDLKWTVHLKKTKLLPVATTLCKWLFCSVPWWPNERMNECWNKYNIYSYCPGGTNEVTGKWCSLICLKNVLWVNYPGESSLKKILSKHPIRIHKCSKHFDKKSCNWTDGTR